MNQRVTTLIASVLFLALPTIARAQDPNQPPAQASLHRCPMMGQMGMMQGQPGMMGTMDGMEMGGMGMMGAGMMGGPVMILRMREPLGLSEQQAERIQQIQRQATPEAQQHRQAAMQGMQQARQTLARADPDLDRYEAQLREAAQHHVLAQRTSARAMIEARGILTPEQREKLHTGMQMMSSMMQGCMQGRMQGGEQRPRNP